MPENSRGVFVYLAEPDAFRTWHGPMDSKGESADAREGIEAPQYPLATVFLRISLMRLQFAHSV